MWWQHMQMLYKHIIIWVHKRGVRTKIHGVSKNCISHILNMFTQKQMLEFLWALAATWHGFSILLICTYGQSLPPFHCLKCEAVSVHTFRGLVSISNCHWCIHFFCLFFVDHPSLLYNLTIVCIIKSSWDVCAFICWKYNL